MEHYPLGGDAQQPKLEQRETLQINSIVIPADDELPLQGSQLDPTSVADYRDLIKGSLEVTTLRYPPASLYINEQGKLQELPLNVRATMLLWMHSPTARYGDFIAGDAVLVGPTGHDGNDTDVPKTFVDTLLETRRFHVEVQPQGDVLWYRNDQTFESWTDAYAHALFFGQWPEVEDIRVTTVQ